MTSHKKCFTLVPDKFNGIKENIVTNSNDSNPRLSWWDSAETSFSLWNDLSNSRCVSSAGTIMDNTIPVEDYILKSPYLEQILNQLSERILEQLNLHKCSTEVRSSQHNDGQLNLDISLKPDVSTSYINLSIEFDSDNNSSNSETPNGC